MAGGLTNAQVAKELFLNPRTIQRHLNSIYHKIGVSSGGSHALRSRARPRLTLSLL